MYRSLAATALFVLALLSAPLRSQGGGFTANDLYVCGSIWTPASVNGIARVDPISGDTALLTSFQGYFDHQGSMAFDPYRQRLLYVSWPTSGSTWLFANLIDAAGNTTSLPNPNAAWDGIAPVGDGRIYYHDSSLSLSSFRWLDAANQVHILYQADGVTPWDMDGAYTSIEDMAWVPAENALFIASSIDSTKCPGFNNGKIHLRKVTLSVDGTRVASVLCNEVEVNPNDGEVSKGLALMTDGDLLLGTHNGLYGPPLPRLIRVRSGDLSTASFALFGDAANLGTAWSTALQRGIAQSHGNQALNAYFDGQVDHGVPVPSTFEFPGQFTAIEEIPASDCKGGWIAYGSGLAGKGGFVPRLYGGGCPQIGDSFTLKIDQVVGGAGGTLFVGLAPAAVPFKGGTFHVGALAITLALGVGGAPGTAGAGTLTLPAALPSDPLLQGLSIYLQAGFTDNTAVKKAALTQGLELEIG
ncbi:MAG TPA: hypothetical protein VFY71_17415 [Planctomycetota bacterium]|nr:hypothetical protein [Planctomycetota bacterium]